MTDKDATSLPGAKQNAPKPQTRHAKVAGGKPAEAEPDATNRTAERETRPAGRPVDNGSSSTS